MQTLTNRKNNAQFVTNQKGKKVAVLIPIKDYEELMEDMIDLAACIERRNEETIPWEQVKKDLAFKPLNKHEP